MGESFRGVLISDLLGAYNGILSLKQKCLVHVLRLIDKWLTYYGNDPEMVKHFVNLKAAVKRVIRLNNRMKGRRLPNNFSLKKADTTSRLRRILNKELDPIKADKFRKKLLDHFDELVTCLNYKGIPSHNNLVERLLRTSVIMRKITFGNRSREGELNHEVIMSLVQTARLQNLNPLPFLKTLLTSPKKAVNIISIGSPSLEGNTVLQPASNPPSQTNQRQVKRYISRLPETVLVPQCA